MNVSLLSAFLVAAICQVQAPVPSADADSTAVEEDTTDAERYERFRALAESYTAYVDTSGEIEAVLREEAIFRWTNPERRAIAGALYIWTHQGRPHATIGVWTYRDTMDSHELQSLSTEPFIARSQAHPDWRPRAAGLAFAPLDSAAPPADSPVRRQVQMRSVARKHFSATLTRSTGASNPTENLRFLPQPIYRYEDQPPGVIDGAMFSFAQGTDPEVFLLLEAREVGDTAKWFYAFAPATSSRVSGFLDGEQIWDNSDQTSKGTFVMYLYADQ